MHALNEPHTFDNDGVVFLVHPPVEGGEGVGEGGGHQQQQEERPHASRGLVGCAGKTGRSLAARSLVPLSLRAVVRCGVPAIVAVSPTKMRDRRPFPDQRSIGCHQDCS